MDSATNAVSMLAFALSGTGRDVDEKKPPPAAKVVPTTVLVTQNGTGTSSVRTVYVPLPGTARIPVPTPSTKVKAIPIQNTTVPRPIQTPVPRLVPCSAPKPARSNVPASTQMPTIAKKVLVSPQVQSFFYTQKVAPKSSSYQHPEVHTTFVNVPLSPIKVHPPMPQPIKIKEEIDPLSLPIVDTEKSERESPIPPPAKSPPTGEPESSSKKAPATFEEMVAFARDPNKKFQYGELRTVTIKDPGSSQTHTRTVIVPTRATNKPQPVPVPISQDEDPLKSTCDPLLGDLAMDEETTPEDNVDINTDPEIMDTDADVDEDIDINKEPDIVIKNEPGVSEDPRGSGLDVVPPVAQTDQLMPPNAPSNSEKVLIPLDDVPMYPLRLPLKGIGLDKRTKLVVYNVVKFFEERKKRYKLHFNVGDTASTATGISYPTIRKVVLEARNLLNSEGGLQLGQLEFSDPKSKKVKKAVKKIVSNVVIDRAIRKIILESYAARKMPPSMKDISGACKLDGIVVGSSHFITNRLKPLGFKYLDCKRRKLLVELPEVTSWRLKYLRDKKKFERQNRKVVFVFEVDVLRRISQKYGIVWASVEDEEDLDEEFPMITILHAANSEGFVDGCLQFVQSTSSVANVKRSFKHSVKWLKSTLIPKVPADSLIVLGHSRYHRTEDTIERPDMSWPAAEILDWLKKRTVTTLKASTPKSILLDVAQNVFVEKQFTIDKLIIEQGHVAAHIPTNHRELNPIEFIWSEIKEKLAKSPDIKTMQQLQEFVNQEFSTCSEQKLKRAFATIQKQEAAFRTIDPKVEPEVEEFIQKLGGTKPDRSLIDADSTDPEASSESDEESHKEKKDDENGPMLTGDFDEEPEAEEGDEIVITAPAKKRLRRRRKVSK